MLEALQIVVRIFSYAKDKAEHLMKDDLASVRPSGGDEDHFSHPRIEEGGAVCGCADG